MGSKVPYNKKLSSGKQWGGGGPRDMQRRQNEIYGTATIQLPPMSVEDLKKLLARGVGVKPEEGVIDEKDQYLSFEEIKRKIDEAVKFTREQERKRYKSGLRNLNDQLNEAREGIAIIEERLVDKDAEVRRLKSQIIDASNEGLEEKVAGLKIRMEEKERVVEKLSGDYTQSVEELKDKMDEMSKKLSQGIVFSDEYKHDSDRPKLKDDVFIDPIEETGLKLDPHIKIEADKDGVGRNIVGDLNKLKRLLDKGEYKPVKEKID